MTKIRVEGSGAGCFGCGTFIVILVIMGIVSALIGDWMIGTLGGADALANWHEVNVVIRVVLLFLLGEVLVPLAVIVFLLSIFGLTPLF